MNTRLPNLYPTIGILVGLGIGLVLASCNERDDTDRPGGRSGLGIHTDAKTGVQYLSNPRGGITPRLNTDGTLVTVPAEKSTR